MAIGAFFDIDGTLVKGDTQKLFALHMIKKGKVSRAILLDLMWWYILYRLHRVDSTFIRNKAMSVTKGVEHKDLLSEFEECYQTIFRHSIYPAIRRRIELHQERGHRTVMVSAAYEPFVKVIAKELGCDGWYGTNMVLHKGRFTGEVKGKVNIGEAKVDALEDASRKLNIDLKRSYAYGDHYLDTFMLSAVGHPICINPEIKLKGVAMRKGWKIVRVRMGKG